jgi:cell wall-associated NlpC family hydrolase
MASAVSAGQPRAGFLAAPVLRGVRLSRYVIVGSLAAALLLTANGLAAPQSADAAASQRTKVVRTAKSHVGAGYKFGATGMRVFDCSGLVYRVYKEVGLLNKIGGGRSGGRTYYQWFRSRGLASRSNPKPGDLVAWDKGGHVGIFIGDGMAVSALNKKYGVRKHSIRFVGNFTAYLHVKLGGSTAGSYKETAITAKTVKTTANWLNVRTGPGTAYGRLATVPQGTRIKVTAKSYDKAGRKWFKGKLPNGRIGWVAAWYTRSI